MKLYFIITLCAAFMVGPGKGQAFVENPDSCPLATPITGEYCSNPTSEDCQYTEDDGSISRCTCFNGQIFACNSPLNNADPNNDDRCPSVQPAITGGDSCSIPLSAGDCKYGEFIWPGSTELTYVTRCTCFDGTFACAVQSIPGADPSNDASCSSTVDCATFGNKSCQFLLESNAISRCSCVEDDYVCYEPAATNGANPNNHPACPAKVPKILDSCPDGPFDRDCLYDEFYFPGSDQVTYITRASCFDGFFQIAVQSTPTTDPNNMPTCPSGTPKDGESCPASLAENSCQYLSGSNKVVKCDCLSNGTFDCGQSFKPKANPGNPPSCPRLEPSNMDDCSFDGDCLYQEVPCFLFLDFLKLYTCMGGKFMEADRNLECRLPCFSGESLVEVQDRGLVPMNQLQINDKVRVGDDNFEPVYSFGHYSPTAQAYFLEMKTEHVSLEVSADHMVFTESQGFVPASSLHVGDKLVHASSGEEIVVESIRTVLKTGVFAPFTPSGKIVVNDVLASNFITLESQSDILVAGSITVSDQWMSHMFEFPHRVACHYLAKCPNERYTNEGISKWVAAPLEASLWVLAQHPVIRGTIFTFVAGIFCLFSVLEACFLYPVVAIASILSLGTILRRRMSKMKSM